MAKKKWNINCNGKGKGKLLDFGVGREGNGKNMLNGRRGQGRKKCNGG